MLGDPADGLLAWARARDDHKMLVVELVDGDVVDNAAVDTAHRRVAHLPGLHVHDIVHEQAIDQSLSPWSFDVDLAHRRQILHADVRARVDMLLDWRRVREREHIIPTPLDHLGRPGVNVIQRRSALRHSHFHPYEWSETAL